jgi:hypothetical protein
MKVYINCHAADWAKIRWKIVEIINDKRWRGTVDVVEKGYVRTRLVDRKCPSCAAFKAHRTMRKQRAKEAGK